MPLLMERKRATITDVAVHAGVSKATVSAALNSTAGVRDTTRQRVLSSAEQLDYRPAGRTRAGAPPELDGARSARSLALLIRESDNPYYAEVIAGARAAIEPRGFTLLVVSSEGDYESERRAVRLLHAKEVDGLMAYPLMDDHADLSHFFELRRRNFPFVLLEGVRGLPAGLIDIDNRAASCVATEHLIGLGHTKLAHFAGPLYSLHTRERIDGVRMACSGALVRFTDANIITAGSRLEDGYRAGLAYFRGRPTADRPTGVTCYNDLVAAGVCSALAELEITVPGDISVVGFDDIPLARYLAVPLTTVHIPGKETGHLAAELLMAQLASSAPVPHERHLMHATLVLRASTGVPPAPP